MAKVTPENVFEMLVRFATIRPRTGYEIKRWLKRKKIDEKQAETLFNRLKKTGLADDRAFANWWIEQRVTFRPKGRRAILFELIRKGVPRDLAKEVIETSKNLPSEEELARRVYEKKKHLPQEKIVGFLSRRGFSWRTIKSVVKEEKT